MSWGPCRDRLLNKSCMCILDVINQEKEREWFWQYDCVQSLIEISVIIGYLCDNIPLAIWKFLHDIHGAGWCDPGSVKMQQLNQSSSSYWPSICKPKIKFFDFTLMEYHRNAPIRPIRVAANKALNGNDRWISGAGYHLTVI